MNWWLRLTSSGWNKPNLTLEDRERTRRSRLAAWVILGLLLADLVLIPTGASSMGSLISVIAFGTGLLLVAALNRAGFVSAAGIILIGLIIAAVIGAVASDPTGLTLDAMPDYDLLAVAVLIGASILSARATFIVAGINILAIGLDFFLQPHASSLITEYSQFPSASEAAQALLARPIALQLITAVVAFLWVRGTSQALRRADRAEEIAALEHSIAEQKRQLDIGVQQILQTHIRAANGDFNARAPLGQENMLWQIAASLNNLLSRLQKAGHAEHQLRRTDEELHRLAAAIDDAQAGRRPIWPAPSGTVADLIIERITRGGRSNIPPSGPRERGAYPDPMPPMPPMPAPASQPWDPMLPPAPPLPPFPPPFSGPSQPLPDEWGRQDQGWQDQGRQDQGWQDQGRQDQGRMSSNPWIFPPEADEHS